MKTPTIPRLYLGTMTFGWSGQTSSNVDEQVALQMVEKFIQRNQAYDETEHLLDTARVYAAGKTEPMVGSVVTKIKTTHPNTNISIGTKANPAMEGGLSKQGIRDQLKASLEAMNVSKIGEFFLHQPDTQHSLLESLQCTHELVEEGIIESIGLSNYHASEVERAFTLCQQFGLTPPTVYQGLYNPLNRLVEEELIPVLHKNECSFVAYNPLAGGLLVKKVLAKNPTDETSIPEGRFKNNDNYLPRFYTKSNFNAITLLQQACEKEGITLGQATYKWFVQHSALKSSEVVKDGVLLGASSVQQLDENLHAWNTAIDYDQPLSSELLSVFDQAWEITKKDGVFPYWRSYSADFPNRENLDPGASYTVKK